MMKVVGLPFSYFVVYLDSVKVVRETEESPGNTICGRHVVPEATNLTALSVHIYPATSSDLTFVLSVPEL